MTSPRQSLLVGCWTLGGGGGGSKKKKLASTFCMSAAPLPSRCSVSSAMLRLLAILLCSTAAVQSATYNGTEQRWLALIPTHAFCCARSFCCHLIVVVFIHRHDPIPLISLFCALLCVQLQIFKPVIPPPLPATWSPFARISQIISNIWEWSHFTYVFSPTKKFRKTVATSGGGALQLPTVTS